MRKKMAVIIMSMLLVLTCFAQLSKDIPREETFIADVLSVELVLQEILMFLHLLGEILIEGFSNF